MAILAVKAASMGAGASGERAAGAEKSAAGYAFSFDDLLAEAKRRASVAYVPPHAALPSWLDKLGQDQYRSIRFDPDADLWRDDGLQIRLE